jgi:hypothetical protein
MFSAYLPTRMDRSFYRAMHDPQFLTVLTRASRVHSAAVTTLLFEVARRLTMTSHKSDQSP